MERDSASSGFANVQKTTEKVFLLLTSLLPERWRGQKVKEHVKSHWAPQAKGRRKPRKQRRKKRGEYVTQAGNSIREEPIPAVIAATQGETPVLPSSRGHSQLCVSVHIHALGAVSGWEAMPKWCPGWEELLSQPQQHKPPAGLAPCPRSTYSANSIYVIIKSPHRAKGTAQPPLLITAFLFGAVSVMGRRAWCAGGREWIREAGAAWISQALCSHSRIGPGNRIVTLALICTPDFPPGKLRIEQPQKHDRLIKFSVFSFNQIHISTLGAFSWHGYFCFERIEQIHSAPTHEFSHI